MPEESTTPDLAELNRRAIESGARGEWDAAMSSYGPDSVWDTSPLGMGTYRGVATIRSNMEEWYGLHEEVEVEIEDNVDLGKGVVFAVVRQRADTPIRRHHRNVGERRGTQIGRVAAARKLLILVYYGLRDGEIRCLAETG